MLNKDQLKYTIKLLKLEMIEAIKRDNEKLQNQIINEVFRIESVIKEHDDSTFKEKVKSLNEGLIEFKTEKEYVIRQDLIAKKFSETMRDIIKKYDKTSDKPISESQADNIMKGLRDRVGIEVNQEQINFINKMNYNQANNIIKRLSHISFYYQREKLSKAIAKMVNREDFDMILLEVSNNIHNREWFEHNKDLIRMSDELLEPSDAQVRKICDLSRYVETAESLSQFNIDIRDYEFKPKDKNYYMVNWELLKKDIKSSFNKQEASNFIQTYDHITYQYEGTKLNAEEVRYLRSLYLQIGDYECTRTSYISTINKYSYERIIRNLESMIKLNKVANNKATQRWREAIINSNVSIDGSYLIKAKRSHSKESRSIVLKQEQEQAKDLTSFVHNIYSIVGQETPEEMRRILPYFVSGGTVKYANVAEEHYNEFRRMVFEQRDVIKNTNAKFNWGAFIAEQPVHVLVALGLDKFM